MSLPVANVQERLAKRSNPHPPVLIRLLVRHVATLIENFVHGPVTVPTILSK